MRTPTSTDAFCPQTFDTPFYRAKFAGLSINSQSDRPFTTKAELVADQEKHPPYGSNLARSLSEYTRLHQTSGTTTGRPLVWLDTAESWNRLLDFWDAIYELVGIRSDDRLFFAFSFGPFIG